MKSPVYQGLPFVPGIFEYQFIGGGDSARYRELARLIHDYKKACEVCIDRCPPEALAMGDDQLPVADMDRCFGCAICAAGCPETAIVMEAKPGFPSPLQGVKELVAALKASRPQPSMRNM